MTSRFVGIAYHIVQLCMYGSFILFLLPFIYFLYGVEAGVLYTDTYMYLRRMGLAGRFSIGVLICICCLFHISAPSLYTLTRWLVVRQTDGSCPFFCRNWKSILNTNSYFRKSNELNLSLFLYLHFQAWTTCHIKMVTTIS